MNTPDRDYSADVAAVRVEIAEIGASIKTLQRVAANLDEARNRAAAFAAAAHAKGAEWVRRAGRAAAIGQDIGDVFRTHERVTGPELVKRAGPSTGSGGDSGDLFHLPTQWARVDLAPWLAVLMGADTFAELICANVGDYAKPGPNAAARAAEIAELQRLLLDAERREEALIVESEATRSPILRRADARPEIVLGA